jgi:hypothetical protein
VVQGRSTGLRLFGWTHILQKRGSLACPNITGLSDNPCPTNGQIGSAIVWDAAGLLDPIGLTDGIDAFTGLDGGRGGLAGLADFGIDMTLILIPVPTDRIKGLY